MSNVPEISFSLSSKCGPILGINPKVGLCPYTPQKEAGVRMEPPTSPPNSIGLIEAATAAAPPPDDPPGVRSKSHGFEVVPYILLYDWISIAPTGRFVFPHITAPIRNVVMRYCDEMMCWNK